MTNKVIAVTGGIGSGKSEVMNIIRKRGYATLNCDVLAREVSERSETVEKVRALIGSEVIKGNKLDRKAIRDKVFCDEELLDKYNGIFFEETRQLLTERLSSLNGTVFVEIPVFYAFDFQWDGVWLIEADEEVRIRRAQLRDGSSRQTLENIIRQQRLCDDFTLRIVNNGNIDELEKQVWQALESV